MELHVDMIIHKVHVWLQLHTCHTCQSPLAMDKSNWINRRRKELGSVGLPRPFIYLVDQTDHPLSFHLTLLFLSPCLSAPFFHNSIKKSISKVVVNLSIYQSINQGDQSSIKILKKGAAQHVILFHCLIAGPPPSFRAALLCSLQHLRHSPRCMFYQFINYHILPFPHRNYFAPIYLWGFLIFD